ncbi:lipopolysaccharide biosynthesis protein [Halogranum rubrum]|uniref:Export protein n=1 Tax=Halogranum salarium B-1 TaxID=1210908 RepID=J3JDW3_9EURY|nr:lipopolysaccharide biosynthesis protein [Halogranum salarium]EJN57839.1 export protein [Halogranum salarium B-1]
MRERLKRLLATLTPGGGVGEQTVKSGIWASLANGLGRSLQFLKLGALTWLLTQAEFGLVGFALLTLAALRRISKLGIEEALIEHRDDDVDAYLDTAWTLRTLRGVGIGTVAFLAAPFIADFFGNPRAEPLIQAMAVLPLLKGLENPGVIYFRKNLAFHREFVYRVGKAATIAVVTVAVAFVYRSAWAFVIGDIVGALAALAISYAIHDYRPRPSFDREQFDELFGYGKWITASGLLVYLINEGDDAFVGWLLGASALGVYQFSYRFSNAPATEITHVVSSVAFPAYSKLQDDVERLRSAFYQALTLTTVLSFPTAVGIVVVAPTFVATFLPPAWEEAAQVMQILALWGLLRSLGATTGPLFQAVGRPDYATKIQFGKLLLIAVLIYPATQAYGIAGTAAVIVLNSALFSEPVASYVAVRTVDGSFRRFFRVVGFPALASVVMGLGVYAVRESLALYEGLVASAVLVVVGVALYVAAVGLLELVFDYEAPAVLRSVVATAGQ